MPVSRVRWEAESRRWQAQGHPKRHSQSLSQNSAKKLEVITECARDSEFNPRTVKLNKWINKQLLAKLKWIQAYKGNTKWPTQEGRQG